MKKTLFFIVLLAILPFLVSELRSNGNNQIDNGNSEGEKQIPDPQTAPSKEEPVDEGEEEQIAMEYEVIQQGTYSGLKEPMTQIVTSQKQWEEIWKKHVSMLVPQPPVPEVDFTANVIAVLAAGEKRSSGYKIVLKEVVSQANDVVINYKMTEPPKDSITLTVLTQPFAMIRVQKPAGVVKFLRVTGAEKTK